MIYLTLVYFIFYSTLVSNPIYSPSLPGFYSFFSRSMSRRIRRPHPSGGGTPLPPTVSEAMELVNPMTGGAEAMDTVQMRSRDFLIPGYPGTRISRRYPYFRPQLPITSHLLSIYYIQHAKICDGLTTFNALLSDRKQKNKMPTVSSFFARVFLTTYYFLLRISSLPNLRTPAQKTKQEKRRKKPPTRQQLLLQNVHLSSVVFDGFFYFCYFYRQWKNGRCKLKKQQKTKKHFIHVSICD